MLRARPGTPAAASASCDPHRPRGAGAAIIVCGETLDRPWLRSSPTPDGRCCLPRSSSTGRPVARLRSSPTAAGRCCLAHPPAAQRLHLPVAILTSPGGDAGGARFSSDCGCPSCDPHRPPAGRCCIVVRRGMDSSTWLRTSLTRASAATALAPLITSYHWRCNPRRPGRAVLRSHTTRIAVPTSMLRSPPTQVGRCCHVDSRPTSSVDRVAILTGPGGRCCRTSPGGLAVRDGCCDPHRPKQAGAASPGCTRRRGSRRCDPRRPGWAGAVSAAALRAA